MATGAHGGRGRAPSGHPGGAVVAIAAKDLRERLRNRTALVLGLVAPVTLTALLGLALGGADEFRTTLAVADLDDGAATATLVADLEADLAGSGITLAPAATRADAARLVEDGGASAAVVVPPDLSARAAAGRPVEVEVLVQPGAEISGSVAVSIAQGVAGGVDTGRLVTATLAALPGAATGPPGAGAGAPVPPDAAAPPVVVERDASGAAERVDATTFFAAAMGTLFLFFVVQFGPRSLVDERRTGTLARLLASPTSRAAVLGGKALGSVVLGTASLSLVLGSAVLFFGADYGSVAGVALLVVADVLAVTAVLTLVGALARTRQQVDNLTTIVTLVLAVLGGNFVYVEDSALFSVLRRLTPNGWTLDGLLELAGGGTGVAAVLPEALAVLAIAAACGGAAFALADRAVRP